MKNSSDNVFSGLSVGVDESTLFCRFLDENDFAVHTRRGFRSDIRKFVSWFTASNHEPFVVARVTTRDVTDFRSFLREQRSQAVATVNRALVSIRRFFDWLVSNGKLRANPAKAVKELKQQQLAPKGLKRTEVRKLLREVELRNDIRANAVFSVLLYTGCRVSDLVNLELHDVIIGERSGSLTFRFGKGNKQRSVPLALAARKSLAAYLEARPPSKSDAVFIGERGQLTDKGVRALCDKYSAVCGFKLHPHLMRHTMAHQFLANNSNDLVALAQLLGHENVNTTARYTQKTEEELGDATDRLDY